MCYKPLLRSEVCRNIHVFLTHVSLGFLWSVWTQLGWTSDHGLWSDLNHMSLILGFNLKGQQVTKKNDSHGKCQDSQDKSYKHI